MGNQGINLLTPAVDDLHQVPWKARFIEQLNQSIRRHGILLRWLQHKGIATSDGHGEHPHRYHRRKIEGGNTDTHTQGLNQAVGIDAASNVFRGLAHHHRRDITGLLNHFDTTPDITLRIGKCFARFQRQNRRDLIVVVL